MLLTSKNFVFLILRRKKILLQKMVGAPPPPPVPPVPMALESSLKMLDPRPFYDL